MTNFSRFALQAALAAAGMAAVQAMEPSPNPYTVTNPDGSTVTLHMEGSEQEPYEVDENGLSVIPVEDEKTLAISYEFGELDEETGDVKPSGVAATDPDGVAKMRARGTGPGLRRSQAASRRMGMGGSGSAFAPQGRRRGKNRRKGGGRQGDFDREAYGVSGGFRGLGSKMLEEEDIEEPDGSMFAPPTRRLAHIDDYEHWDESVEDFHRRQLAVNWTGTKKNLVIPMRFKDHTNRWLPTQSELDILFNSDTPDATYAPTGSVKQVFKDSSYDKLNLVSDVQDWITLDETEAYYANGNRGFTTQMHQAMLNALIKLEAANFDFGPYDSDKDGLIDSICFLHSGFAAEFGGTDEFGAVTSDRIWSHKWAMYSFRYPSATGPTGFTSSSGVRVYNYHISPAVYGTSTAGKSTTQRMGRIGVIAHETGHFLGITDLYDTAGLGGSGIGSWGLMANSWGFNGDQYYPPMMGPWTKEALGWLAPTKITNSGTYELMPSYTEEQVYKISAGFAADEYLLIEYRKAIGFDVKIGHSMPTGGGLAIWHIDNRAGYNDQGWPGQVDADSGVAWPQNGLHYRVSLLAADGLYDLEQARDRGDRGDLFYPGGVTSLGPNGAGTNQYPNTDSYQGGTIASTGIDITNIRFAGTSNSKMAFDIVIPGTGVATDSPTRSPTTSPTASPTGSPVAAATNSPTGSPVAAATNSPTGSPVAAATNSPTVTDSDLGQWTQIDFENFDGSDHWGKWNDGGSDARLSSRDRNYAKSGNYAVRLRDNTSSSVMTHDAMNVQEYLKLKVSFTFYARSMENGEDFWLQVSSDGGSSWTNVAEFKIDGGMYSNGSFYDETVEFTPASMTATTQVRFRCDASGNADYVYIDDVEISGWTMSG